MNGVITHSVIGSDTFLVKSLYSPTQLFYPLPYTYNDQWASDFTITNTTYYNGFPFLTTYAYHTEAVTVDAWGNMTMPGGVVVAALRVRRDDRYTSPSPPFYVRTVSYSFMSKFGDMVEATAIDTNVSNSGVIQTEGVSWRRSDLVSVGKEDYTPAKYSLSQNYPNPFNPSTNISFSVGTYSHTFLRVYDILGREVETIFSGVLSAGNYTKQWNAKNYPSGVYFYRLQAGTFTETKKLVLLK
jgi:hypothetical protein